MKPAYNINAIKVAPGIQRDNTDYAATACIDGQWMRTYEGVPYKIGGFSLIEPGVIEIMGTPVIQAPVSNMYAINNDNNVTIVLGRFDGVNYFNMDLNANALPEQSITFAPAITPISTNVWDFDIFTTKSVVAADAQLVIQYAPSGIDIANQQPGGVYYGAINNLAATFTQATLDSVPTSMVVSGGIVFVSPFMLAYGNNGVVYFTDDVEEWTTATQASPHISGSFVAANTKIVKIVAIRGAAQPTALIWSLTTLALAVYQGLSSDPTPVPIWSVQTIESNISIMSPDTVVQYDQTVFWIGIDQFYTYTGVVKRLPNTMNNDFFFRNVNYQARGACWAMAIPRFSEIWYFYPRVNPDGPNPTYCTHAVIFNVSDGSWSDTPLTRSCGVSASVFPFPIMASSAFEEVPNIGESYPIWRHEYGTDKVVYGDVFAIQSFFETNKIDLWTGDPANAYLIYNRRICPDFIMTGPMTVSIRRQEYPQSDIFEEGPFTFQPNTPYLDFASQGGIVSFRFESNVTGGFYQMGKPLFFYNIGDTLK